jgi:hypothetical protein
VTLIALLCIIVIAPYVRFTAYQSVDVETFRGREWYNPYTDITDALLRANFHAHSKSWAGLTWGENSASELIDEYASHGYQIPALSNYHKITPGDKYASPLIYIPVYEHGFNPKKIHCLCIGAKDVGYFDYPWHFSADFTRHIIYNLREHCDLVALAHPGARNAHVPEDMPSFDGLQLMEVANTQGARTQYWDAILSAGRAVWFLANDDTHAFDDGEAFMRWNMIYVDTPSSEAAIQSLKRGNHYGIFSYNRTWEDNRLTEFKVSGDTLRISLRDTFNRVDFIGQDGERRHVVGRDTTGWYLLRDSDTYIRAEIHQNNCVMYLNPVIRYDGVTPPHERIIAKSVLTSKTWLGRLVSLLMIGLILYGWVRWMKR